MRLLAGVIVVLALAGCAQTMTPVGTQPVAGELTGEWAPVAGSDGDGVFTVLPETGSLVFGNGQAFTAGGCGAYVPQPLNKNLVVTTSANVRYCVGPSDTDRRISAKLGDVTSALVGETLYLTGVDFELELERVPAVSPDALQGDWTLDYVRMSDVGFGGEKKVALHVDGTSITADCVSANLYPVSGLNTVTDLVISGTCTKLPEESLKDLFDSPFLIRAYDDGFELLDLDSSLFYHFVR